MDLIRWLKDWGYADTSGQAIRLILDDRVMSESHVVGKQMVNQKYVVQPFIAADLRKTLVVNIDGLD